ncbi:hypothetical protein AMTRI_Chr02g213450 [Amborella trichopoda]
MASSLQDPFLTYTKEERDEGHQAQAHEGHTTENHKASIDQTIEDYVGSFGPGQLAQTLLVSFAWCFDAQHTFISIFPDAEPTWHCTSPSGCGRPASVCEIGADMWAWDRGAWASTVSEWGLSCSSRVIAGLPASAFFLGCLVGEFWFDLIVSFFGKENLEFLFLVNFSLMSRSYKVLRFFFFFSSRNYCYHIKLQNPQD